MYVCISEYASQSLIQFKKTLIFKLWLYFSIFFATDFLGRVNLLFLTHCIFFFHFPFNCVSITLKLCLNHVGHLQSFNVVDPLQYSTYLALVLVFVRHLLFDSFIVLSNAECSDSPLAISCMHFPIAHLLNTENKKGSIFRLPSGDYLLIVTRC